MRRRLVIIGIVILSAIVIAAGLRGVSYFRVNLSSDHRAEVDLSLGRIRVPFTPHVNSVYDVVIFPGEDCKVTRFRLFRGKTALAESSDGRTLSFEMEAGVRYRAVIEGSGHCVVEVMRRAEGRSLVSPADVDKTVNAMIAREGNAGWFTYVADRGQASVWAIPGEGSEISLNLQVYDEQLVPIAESVPLVGGACAAYFEAREGQKFFIRASSPDGGTGAYAIKCGSSGECAPENMTFMLKTHRLRAGDIRAVRPRLFPYGACEDVIWFSSEPSVISVDDNGYITAESAGSAAITAYAWGGITKTIEIIVDAVEPEEINYTPDSLVIHQGDSATPMMSVYPAAASAQCEYVSSDALVAVVDGEGVISGVGVGQCVVTARCGELTADIFITVDEAPPRYRALMIGEQFYAGDVNEPRIGSINTVYNIESMFSAADFGDGQGVDCRVMLDLTGEQTREAISEFFGGAREIDISILYISCHGMYRDGQSVLQFCDGSEMTASEMELVLRRVPGTIVIMVDCCASGGFIGGAEEFTGGITAAFSGQSAAFAGSKYKLLLSAAANQDSYRIGYGDGEGDIATVFARALCDGLGWDMDSGKSGALSADIDYNRRITLWEAYLYANRRVHWYLNRADGGTGRFVQDVKVYPEGDPFVLFRR